MDNNIFQWLNSNINHNSLEFDRTSLIECLLIISINGVLVEKNSLINYCRRIVNNNNQENNDDMIINGNNKRKNNNNNIQYEDVSYYYGLSKQQFQTIYNSIESINNTNSCSSNNNNNNNNNNNIDKSLSTPNDEDYISNKIKFNNSISIITENNKRILKQKSNNSTTKPYNNNISRKKIKSNNDDENSTPIGICINNKNNCIDTLFFKVWRNIVIRNEILFHLKLYNIHLNKEIHLSLNQLSTYKFKSYINVLGINRNDDGNGDDEGLEDELFEDNDQEIEDMQVETLKPNLLSSTNISHINIYCNIILQVNSLPESLTEIVFCNGSLNQIFTKGVFPDSITSLKFGDYNFNQKLSLDWLPKSLRALYLFRPFQHSIEPNQLPQTLTELGLPQDYKGIIVPGSIPLSIKSLNYKFNSYNQNKLTNESIPKSTTNLEFNSSFRQPIKVGDIPHNVSSIKFGYSFNSEIEVGSLPKSLTSLHLGESFSSFNESISANSLPNLTYINMSSFNQPLVPNLFPQSITAIKFFAFDQPIPDGYFYNYKNLKSLEFIHLNQNIPENTLPNSLTFLTLGYHYNGSLSRLPTSILTLKLYGSHIQLLADQLPSSITSLTIKSTNPIIPRALPCKLKTLHIVNPDFSQDLSNNNILPQSLQTIYIDSSCFNFINSLDANFFNKYIKFI